MRKILVVGATGCVLLAALLWASASMAVTPGPGWEITSRAVPTNFSAKPPFGFPDGYTVMVTNAGSEPTDGSAVTITDTLPAGLTATEVTGADVGRAVFKTGGAETEYPEKIALTCTLGSPTVSCTDTRTVPPGDVLYLSVVVSVSPMLPEGSQVTNTATVFGGGGASGSTSQPTAIDSQPASFGLERFSAVSTDLAGGVDEQAGDHPYENSVTYDLNVNPAGAGGAGPVQDTRDFIVDLPSGFLGNPQVVQRCSQETLAAQHSCPASDQVGVAKLTLSGVTHSLPAVEMRPIYNMQPDPGYPAEFGFNDQLASVYLLATVSRETSYSVRIIVAGIPKIAGVSAVTTTFFGTPLTDPNIYNKSVGANDISFLQDPVDCSAEAQEAQTSADSWQSPGQWLANGAPDLSEPNWKAIRTVMFPALTGCEALHFDPSITVTPSTDAGGRAYRRGRQDTHTPVLGHQPTSRDAGAQERDGDAACGCLALAFGRRRVAGVQRSAGRARIDRTGGVPERLSAGNGEGLHATVVRTARRPGLLGAPRCDPCTSADAADGNMLRIYLVAQGSGVRVKKAGNDLRQPLDRTAHHDVHRQPRATVRRPRTGLQERTARGPRDPPELRRSHDEQRLHAVELPEHAGREPDLRSRRELEREGEACPALAPLNPGFSAGTSNPNAGQFSPLTVTFSREDREQDIAGIQVRTPPGLLGSLSGIPLCGEPQASLGTCSEASRIGSMTVAAGPGSHPFYVKGSLYVTGPYEGAPFGLSIVVPTVAGPFNLGNVVVRARIGIDSQTTALTVTTDPLPQVIDGVPLRLRSANVTIDRPGFIFNPTNCSQLHIEATIAGAQGSVAHDSAPFAVSGCAGLPFGPKFSAYAAGHTSRANGASLYVHLQYPKGAQSNISHVKVELPKQLPSRLTTLQKACPDNVFESNPSACPAASVVGIATATTPVLPVPLSGPAYFVSHGGAAFPNLDRRAPRLRGQGRTDRRHLHLLEGHHQLDVHERPRRAGQLVRPVPAGGTVLGARGEREPLQEQTPDADLVHRTGRRTTQTEHQDSSHGLQESQGERREGRQSQKRPQVHKREHVRPQQAREGSMMSIAIRRVGLAGLAVLGASLWSTGAAHASVGLLETFSSAAEPGTLNEPSGIAVDQSSGDLYVADTKNSRVVEYDAAGRFVLMFGGEVNETRKTDICTQVEVETEGVKCQPGTSGSAAGQFVRGNAGGIAVDPTTGDVYVEDTDNERVEKFTSAGVYLTQVVVPNMDLAFKNVATDLEGNLYVATRTGILKFNSIGEYSGIEFPVPPGAEPFEAFAVGPEGDVDALLEEGSPGSTRDDALYRFLPNGKLVGTVLGSSPLSKLRGSVTIDPRTDDLFVTSYTGQEGSISVDIKEYSVSGAPIAEFPVSLPGQINQEAAQLAYGIAAGRLYYVTASDDAVYGYGPFPKPSAEAPTIVSESSSDAAATSVSLSALVDPNLLDTTYYFQYSTSPTFAGAANVPISPVDIGSSELPVSASASLSGLQEATTYNYRVVAVNASGGIRRPVKVLQHLRAVAGGDHRRGLRSHV